MYCGPRSLSLRSSPCLPFLRSFFDSIPVHIHPGTLPGQTVTKFERKMTRSAMLFKPARFFRQHDRNAIADRIGELGLARDQLLLIGVVFKRSFGDRTYENFQQFRIDAVGGSFG